MKFLNQVLHDYALPPVKTPPTPRATRVADRLSELEEKWKVQREQPHQAPKDEEDTPHDN